MKKYLFLLFFIPSIIFAQQLPEGAGEINPSLLPGLGNSDTEQVESFPGINDDTSLVPRDLAPPPTNDSNQYPNTNTSFTPTTNATINSNPSDPSSAINTSILNQPAPNYPSLTPAPKSVGILNQIIDPENLNLTGDQPLNNLLNQLFYIGLISAVVLAIIMIIRGGIEYMTIDSISGKDSGKKRVQAALGGLVLAFAAILILNTINPGLTNLSILFPRLDTINSIELEADINSAMAKYSGLTPQKYQSLLASGKIPTNISPTAQKVLAEAYNMLGFQTGTIPGTEAGNLACAAVVNKIFTTATGKEVGGNLSTAAMATSLEQDPRFVEVPGGYASALPGDIIISPTSAKGSGHVGIVASPGATEIISNSSSGGKTKIPQVMTNHSASSWEKLYRSKGLEVKIYRPL